MKLHELLSYLLKESTQFDIEEFKKLKTPKDILEYAKKRLEELGQGSRIVFKYSDSYALKVAAIDEKSKQGIDQNKAEYTVGINATDSNILPQVQENHHPNFIWIMTELVEPIKNWNEFRQLTGLDEDDMLDITDEISLLMGDGMVTQFGPYVPNEELLKSNLAQEMLKLTKYHKVSPSDMRGIRQWGKTKDEDSRVVLLDSGGTYEVLKKHQI